MNHRHLIAATSGVYLLGNAMFAAALAPIPAIAVWIGCAGAFWLVWTAKSEDRDSFLDAPIDARLFGSCLLAALAILILGGEGHFFHAVNDWLIRDATLTDIVHRGVLAAYQFEGRDYALRAPIGMYVVPALAGQWTSLFGAHLAMVAQNAVLLASILYVFGYLAPGHRLAVLALMIFFAGLDIAPVLAQAIARRLGGDDFWLPTTLTVWAPWFAYVPSLQDFFWAPNHALPGWWFAALALLVARRELDVAGLAAAAAPLALWSPLAIACAPFFLLLFVARQPARALASPRNWMSLFACCLFFPVAAYLTAASDTIASSWTILRPGFWLIYALTIAVELPQLLIVAIYWRLTTPERRPTLVLSAVLLLAIPAFGFGPVDDFVLRTPIAPLAILAFEFAVVATRIDPARQPVGRLAIVCVVGIGLFGPGFEILRAFVRARFAISDCGLMQAARDFEIRSGVAPSTFEPPSHYVAALDRMPRWLIVYDPAQAVPFEPRVCWPDHPLLSQFQPK